MIANSPNKVPSNVTRRIFLKVVAGAGAGLTLGSFVVSQRRASAAPTTEPATPSAAVNKSFTPSAFVRINPDGKVIVTISKSEFGQGARTSLAMMVAEELDAAWNMVSIEQAPGDGKAYGSQMTAGSGSTKGMYKRLRTIGAAARLMLVTAAAKQWGVSASECTTDNGMVRHAGSGKSASYGELSSAAALISPPADRDVKIKDAADFKLIGKPTSRVDNAQVVVGNGRYSMDVKVPGMVYAVVVRPPTFGGAFKSMDDSAARQVAGVSDVFQMSRGVAVVGNNTWAAMKGAQALKVEWDAGPNTDLNTAKIHAQLVEAVGKPVDMAGAKVIEATFDFPYLAHVTMEPLNAVADVRDGSCTVWAGVQGADNLRTSVARAVKMPQEAVTVNATLLGGAFGRRSNTDFVMEAVEVSAKVKKPVKLVWTREDDVKFDGYRAMSHHALRAGLDENNKPVGWSHTLANANYGGGGGPRGRGGAGPDRGFIYDISNAMMNRTDIRTPVPTGWWRAVENTQLIPAIECFMDELAHAAGQDPFAFRKALVKDPRLANVLMVAAEKGDWGKPLPAGSGRGIACFAGLGSFAAHVAEVTVSGDAFKVTRVVCVSDCGQMVNPRTVEAQLQGACVDAIATALRAEITIDKGAVVQSSFPDYQWAYMADVPRIDVVMVQSNAAPGGVGELGYPTVMPAIANAIAAVTGKRVRKFPIKLNEMV